MQADAEEAATAASIFGTSICDPADAMGAAAAAAPRTVLQVTGTDTAAAAAPGDVVRTEEHVQQQVEGYHPHIAQVQQQQQQQDSLQTAAAACWPHGRPVLEQVATHMPGALGLGLSKHNSSYSCKMSCQMNKKICSLQCSPRLAVVLVHLVSVWAL